MSGFIYAVMNGNAVVEFRSYPQAMQVGPGAPGEFANMVAATTDQLAALAAAAPKVPPTPRQWLERLAPATENAIFAAAATNPAILQWLFKAAGNPSIDVTLAETIAGVAEMVAAGLITAQDQATLLAP